MAALPRVGPDDFNCKRCGKPVRYAMIRGARMNVAFDARTVLNGGYTLVEEEQDGQATGKWIAEYTRVADRDPKAKAYRQHNCKPVIEEA